MSLSERARKAATVPLGDGLPKGQGGNELGLLLRKQVQELLPVPFL